MSFSGRNLDNTETNIKTYLIKTALLFLMPFIFCINAYSAVNGVDKELLNASTRGDTETVAFCLESGANPDTRDRLGNTPLILACDGGYQEIVRQLLGRKASVNAINKFGYTPLLSAVTAGHRYIASLLIKAGADSSIKNKYGTSAEDYIKIQGFFTMNEYASGAEAVISTKIDDREPRRGELGALHNPPWRETFNRLLAENKSGEAAAYLVERANENNYEAAFLLGALLIERNNTEKGVEWLKNALKSDDSATLYNVAVTLLEIDDPKEILIANSTLKRAMEMGNVMAKTAYAKNLLNGVGTTTDKIQAYTLFSEGAKADYPEALYYKSLMEYTGIIPKSDEKLALENIRKAAEMGYENAKIFLDKQDSDNLLKQIANGDVIKDRNTAKVYFLSINAVPLTSDTQCDEYNLSGTFLESYKLMKAKICNGQQTLISFYISPAISDGEAAYLKNISGNVDFIKIQMEDK